jgi:hypothetical protein
MEILGNINKDGENSGSSVEKLDENVTCEKHQLELECYCVDCKEILCTKCVFRDHRRHKTQSLEETSGHISKEVDGYLELIKAKITSLNENLNLTRNKMDRIRALTVSTKKMIKEQADILKAKRDKDEQSLIAEVEQQSGAFLEALTKESNNQYREIISLKNLETRTAAIFKNVNRIKAVQEFNSGLLEQLKISSKFQPQDQTKISPFTIQIVPSLLNLENIVGAFTVVDSDTSYAQTSIIFY